MQFVYKNKDKITQDLIKTLEEEFIDLTKKYHLSNPQNQVHLEIERLKNLSWKIKSSWWIVQMGKKLIATSAGTNIHKVIHQIREKLDSQITKNKN